jgi:hypothetical protein
MAEPKVAWIGEIQGINPDSVFSQSGEVMVKIDAVLADYSERQYTPIVGVNAGDGINQLLTSIIEWIKENNNESLPGALSVDIMVEAFAPEFGESIELEQAEFEQGGRDDESSDSSSGG